MKRGSPKEDERVTKGGSQQTQEDHLLTICPSQLDTELKISLVYLIWQIGKTGQSCSVFFQSSILDVGAFFLPIIIPLAISGSLNPTVT